METTYPNQEKRRRRRRRRRTALRIPPHPRARNQPRRPNQETRAMGSREAIQRGWNPL